jgi:hypothetical protein
MAIRMFVLVALLLVGAIWPASVLAQTTHPLHPYYTNVRAQIGNGLPIPITGTPPPNGRVKPIPGATVMQGLSPVPSIMIAPGQITTPGFPLNLGVFPSNNKVFQVQTSLAVSFPKSTVTFAVNGRTGPATVTWCPGLPVPTASYNPSCDTPSVDVTLPPNGLFASFKYTKTANQFGGPAQSFITGIGPGVAPNKRGAVVAVRAGASPAPCTVAAPGKCRVAFDTVDPATTGAAGGAFGFTNMTPGGPPVFPGVFNVSANAAGVVTFITSPGLPANGFTNMATSHGAPATTGMLTVLAQNTANAGTEVFVLSGSDNINPVLGTRKIALVSGAVSQRVASLPNANRGWVNLYLPEPGALAGTIGALLALVTCHNLVRRRPPKE